jgi:bifunctional lysine-specific demethylase and histidyl-hydroxylase NO66
VSVEALNRTAAHGSLARCVNDPEAFLRDAWGCRATVQRDGDHRGFDDLLTLDDVDRFLTATSIRTPYFRLVKAGEQIPESAYTRSGRTGSREVHGMADPARVADLFEDGATLVLQGLHRWSEPVTRFCRDLELELGHPCQANAYITPSGAQGLALHEDQHDVFVLQAFGRKRWEVHGAPVEDERAPLDVEIGPGDTIYMPTGTPHAASTQDVLSGHLTIGVHVTSWREVLDDLWSRIDAGPASAGDVPAGWTRDPEGFARELRARAIALADALAAIDAHEVFRRREEGFLSSRPQLARGAIAERSAPIVVEDATVVRRRPDAICEIRRRSDALVVLLGDRRLEMPQWLEPTMRRIEASITFTVRDLSADLPDAASRAVLVGRLIREGLLTPRETS